jgi:hypothetical protein
MITPDGTIYALPKEVPKPEPEVDQRIWGYNPVIFGTMYPFITINTKPPQYFLGGYPVSTIPTVINVDIGKDGDLNMKDEVSKND